MIIGIKGWQRAGKTGLGAIIASGLEGINQGYGNLSLYGMPFPFEKKPSRQVLDRLFQAFNQGEENLLFFIDEAHRILNPRLWDKWTKEDTYNLAGIFQDDKLDITVIYTFHPGYKDEELLGVDKNIRGSTGRMIDILTKRKDIEKFDRIIYKDHNRAEGLRPIKKKINNFSKYYPLWKTKEHVV